MCLWMDAQVSVFLGYESLYGNIVCAKRVQYSMLLNDKHVLWLSVYNYTHLMYNGVCV